MTRGKTKWLNIRVELVHGNGQVFEPPPGRDFLVGPHDSFSDLAEAINTGFARWDISHLHMFRLPNDRVIGIVDEDADDTEDEQAITVADELKKDEEFVYIFDFGDDWTHNCRVLDDDVDPDEAFGGEPDESPVPIWGWGSIPDQYGREAPEG